MRETSIVTYRELRESDPAAARKHLDDLEEYNGYDCLSTQRLRAWLLARARDSGVFDQIKPRSKAVESEAVPKADPQVAQARQDLTQRLLALAGDGTQATRTAEQQGFAMLASALNYYRLERNTFWWEHFPRLQNSIEEWADTRDVFVVDKAVVEQDCVHPVGGPRNHRGFAVYAKPKPPGFFGPEAAPYWAAEADDIEEGSDD
jgi:hypothetical protein